MVSFLTYVYGISINPKTDGSIEKTLFKNFKY